MKSCLNCVHYHYNYDFDTNDNEIDLSICDKENYECMESHDSNGYYGYPEECEFYKSNEEQE